MVSAELRSMDKIWIPEDEFFSSEDIIALYIKSRGLDPKKTLRFAEVLKKGSHFDELLIPSTIVQTSGDSFAECFESVAKLTATLKKMGESPTPTVDYTTTTFAGPKS